jgi:Zn-finger nucleic acid-binding protein
MLCQTCNTPLERKHNDAVGATLHRCPACKTVGVDGSSLMLTQGDGVIEQLRQIKRRIDDEQARHELMMSSPISDPMWTNLST